MKNRMPIGIDVDGVCADFSSKFLEMARERYGRPPQGFVQTRWDFNEALSDTEIEALWDEIKATKNWWLTLKPMPDTDLLSHYWRDYKIYFITHRVETAGLPCEVQTALWLEREFGLPDATVIADRYKGCVIAGLGIKVFLDDKPSNVEEAQTVGGASHCVLKDATYNRECALFERVANLNEFLRRLA